MLQHSPLITDLSGKKGDIKDSLELLLEDECILIREMHAQSDIFVAMNKLAILSCGSLFENKTTFYMPLSRITKVIKL